MPSEFHESHGIETQNDDNTTTTTTTNETTMYMEDSLGWGQWVGEKKGKDTEG
jgi:hypothetical protein